ncbi:DUF7512 family protein [Halorussus litoreus]|uniref:DUF7512 family protein n=1 Tax=Halorussus litoreus TaxID=1710536 RepID=UPI0018E550FE|nr:hypothetical protein [Halorussus litoreus]
MFGIEDPTAIVDALQVIGIVLLEAILLYVGYGLLEWVLGPTLVDALRGEQ